MSINIKARPLPDSDEESLGELSIDKSRQKRTKLMKELASRDRPGRSFVGGIVVSSETELKDQSTNSSLSAAEKKGLKEVEELERELDLKNTFSKETNRRDEDAEMNKYIEEQIRQRRDAAERERERRYTNTSINRSNNQDPELVDKFILPTAGVVADVATERVDDILLHTLAKNYSTTTDEKSEAMLSNQMLNGIPEVDLGMNEKIRTIEATEEAKLSIVSTNSKSQHSQSSHRKPHSVAPINFSSNFQQHRSSRGKNDGELRSLHASRDSRSTRTYLPNSNDSKTISEPVVLVGEEPKEVEYRVPTTSCDHHKPPMRGRASDDYYLQKFKKNSRR